MQGRIVKKKTNHQTESKSSRSFEDEHEDGNEKHYILIDAMQLVQD